MFFKLPCFEGENEYRFVISRIHDAVFVSQKIEFQCISVEEWSFNSICKRKNTRREFIKKGFGRCKNGSDIAAIGLKHFFRSKGLYVDVEKSQMSLRY